MGERYTATITEIAEALKISRQAVHKKAKQWQSTGDRVQGGGDRYDIDEIPLSYRERKTIRTALTRKNGSHLRLVPSIEEQQAEAAEKERLRLEAREQGLAIFSRLPEQQQRGANAKLEIIKACNTFITVNRLAKHAGQDAFAHEYSLGRIDLAPWVYEEVKPFHPGTLRSWIAEEYELGMVGLVDKYGNRKGQAKIETYITGINDKGEPVRPLADTILALVFKTPHIKPERIEELLPTYCPGAPTVSAKSIKRWVDAWKEQHQQEWAYIANPDDWKNKHLTAGGEMDEGIRYIPNARWEIDATPADLFLTDGRYKIIGLIDVGTRRLILKVTATEKGLDNARVVRSGIIQWGVPTAGVFISDQGNPYKSELFRRFLDGLDIEHEFCPAFSGDRKPFIERAFHTFSHDLVELLPGYCGHNVAEQQAIRAQKSFAQRLMKKGEVIEASMTAEEFQAFVDRWCAAYHDRKHSKLGKSPNQVVSEWGGIIRRISDERALDVLLSPVAGDGGWRTVNKKGITINKHDYLCPEFGVIRGKVLALETEDIGRVIVHRRNEFDVLEFVGIAICPELDGTSRAELAAIPRAKQKQIIAQANELKKQARKELRGQDLAEAILQHRQSQAKTNVSHFPRPTKEYTTPALEAAGQAAAALRGEVKAPAQEINPQLQEMRRQLEAEMATTKVVSLPAPEPTGFQIPADAKGKYRLWCQLDGQITGGLELGERELRFYNGFKRTAEWRGFRGVDEDLYSLRK